MKNERSRRRSRVRRLFTLVLAVVFLAPMFTTRVASAEFPPQKLENLQVLPKEISVPELIGIMKEFSGGLGVRCQHCHLGEEGEPLSAFDFTADDKEAKRQARVMLRMTRAINEKHLPELGGDGSSRITVQCVTCHRGQARPAMLGEVLVAELDAGGVEAATAKYRQLRGEFYGGHSFDFSEWTLISLGETLARGGRAEASEAMLELNLEFFPESTSSWDFLAEFYRRQERIDEARAAVAKALAIDPEDRRAQQILSMIDEGG